MNVRKLIDELKAAGSDYDRAVRYREEAVIRAELLERKVHSLTECIQDLRDLLLSTAASMEGDASWDGPDHIKRETEALTKGII